MENNNLNLMHLLKKKVYHLINKKNMYHLISKKNIVIACSISNEIAKSNITKDENDENVAHFEITEVVLVPFNVVNNDYQQDSTILYIFISNKWFGQLLDISPKKIIFYKNFSFRSFIY